MALLDGYKRAELDKVFEGRLFIKTPELAKLIGVSTRYIQRWVDMHIIEYCDRTPGGGHYLFDRATVEEIIQQYIRGELLGDIVLSNTQQLSFLDIEFSPKK